MNVNEWRKRWGTEIGISNSTLHSVESICPICRVVAKDEGKEMPGIQYATLAQRAWKPTVRTTENSSHIWHSFKDEYLLDPRAWVINVANWLASYGSKKRMWWTTRWTLWEPRAIHTPVCWQILSLERFLLIKILAKTRKVAVYQEILYNKEKETSSWRPRRKEFLELQQSFRNLLGIFKNIQ